MIHDSKSRTRLLGILLGAALLAGCVGQLPAQTAQPALGSVSSVSEAKATKPILYIADYSPQGVLDFTYPSLKYKKTFTKDVNAPLGACGAANGDFWVVNSGNNEILGYEHGKKKPSTILSESDGDEIGCAEDGVTGNLAVAILTTGHVLVYANASGNPTTYSTPLAKALYAAYDDDGNLFVDGYTASNFGLVELPKGSSNFVTISLDVNLGYASPIQYVSPYLVLGDAASDEVYQFSISGSTGTEANSFELSGAGPLVEFAVYGDEIAAIGGRSTGLWKYPAGGKAVATISNTLISNPQAVVVSP